MFYSDACFICDRTGSVSQISLFVPLPSRAPTWCCSSHSTPRPAAGPPPAARRGACDVERENPDFQQNKNVFYIVGWMSSTSIRVVVWGTGNVGRAAIRAVDAHPDLDLAGVIVHDAAKVGRDAGDLSDVGRTLGVAATDDISQALAIADAVVYAASGDIRPDDALDRHHPRNPGRGHRGEPFALRAVRPDLCAAGAAGPGPRGDRRRRRLAVRVRHRPRAGATTSCPMLASGLASTIDQVRCQEIFDYTTYDQPDSVRYLIGMGQPMDYEPPMVAPTVPTMVWGGQIRLIARALGVEIDEIRETLLRRPLDTGVDTAHMGDVRAPARRAPYGSRCRESSAESR